MVYSCVFSTLICGSLSQLPVAYSSCQVSVLLSSACKILTMYSAAVHGYLGQHQPLDANGQPIMDDPGLIFFEQVSNITS
jgi:hypothetical protein